jgi:hypothetical protein
MDANRLVFEQTTNTRIRPVQGHRTMADVIAGFDDLTY